MMKNCLRQILRIFLPFITLTLLFQCQRMLFLWIYSAEIGAAFTESLSALGHGFLMDLSMAGYLTAIPAIVLTVALWTRRKWPAIVLRGYYGIIAVILAAIFALDLALYGHWGFRLDMTPVFYIATSVSSAMASVTAKEWVIGLAAFIVSSVGIYLLLVFVTGFVSIDRRSSRIAMTVCSVVVMGLLVLAIRGGVTVSTMNPSRAYFSSNPRLNHAAMNPMFSLLYSAMHQDDFASQYRFMDENESERIAASLRGPRGGCNGSRLSLTTQRPDIYIVILESFSAHVMPSLGGNPIAMRLDSIAGKGALWENFYACSFRTDRALPVILNGVPAQPSASILKYVDKVEKLPAIAKELKRQAGYETAYYYGGDENFANMHALIVSGGFDRSISDHDFAVKDKLSKWGAHDDKLFERALRDNPTPGAAPQFRVIQTSSSHEPFKVPASMRGFEDDLRANSIAYADSCLGEWVNAVNANGRQSLIIIVPDHYGTWPERDKLTTLDERHHIPLVMTGTALQGIPARFTDYGSQIDIAPTLLSLLGLDSSMFTFGNDLLCPSSPHYAWITEPETAAIFTAGDKAELSLPDDKAVSGSPEGIRRVKAYLQVLYSKIDSL